MDDIKKVEARAYGKGYAAGRRKMESDTESKQRRFDLFYAAAMTGLLAAPKRWERDGKPDQNTDDYADTAAQIAAAMVKRVR